MKKTRQRRVDEITDLCEQAGCNDKRQKIHAHQYVDKRWNPHPPQDFVLWFTHHPDQRRQGIDMARAFNTDRYRIQWYVARQLNLTPEQAARVRTQPASSHTARKAHFKWLLLRKRVKPEDAHAYFDDPVFDMFDAIRNNKPLKPILIRMGVYDEPEVPATLAEGFAKLKSLVANIGKAMPKINEGDVGLESSGREPDPF
jgi:hypothetical protein